MRIQPIEGEPTRFHAESASLICKKCGKRDRNRHKPEGEPCVKCGGALERYWHVVDIAELSANGKCSCDQFDYKLRPKLAKLSPAELHTLLRSDSRHAYRCQHILAARDFAIDRDLVRMNEKLADTDTTHCYAEKM